jgi:FlaA1/EpsC-like NDP-sugar epimerase
VNGKDIVLATTGTKFLIIAAIQLVTFKLLGVYRTVWWATGAGDFALLFRSCAAGMVVSYLALRIFDMPTSATTALLRFFFFFPAVTAMRFSHVVLSNAARGAGRAERALICGTAAEARHAVAHLGRNGMSAVHPIGFIEIRPHLQGRQLGRLPVLGTLDGLAGIVTDRHVQHLVIADPALRGEALRWARAICRHFGIALHRYVEKLVPVEGTTGVANGGVPRGSLPANGGPGIVSVAAISGAAAGAVDAVTAAAVAHANAAAGPNAGSAWRPSSRSYKPVP